MEAYIFTGKSEEYAKEHVVEFGSTNRSMLTNRAGAYAFVSVAWLHFTHSVVFPRGIAAIHKLLKTSVLRRLKSLLTLLSRLPGAFFTAPLRMAVEV
jgi:hypothetical protein